MLIVSTTLVLAIGILLRQNEFIFNRSEDSLYCINDKEAMSGNATNAFLAVVLVTLFILVVSMLMVVISIFKRNGKNKIGFWSFTCRRDRGTYDEDGDGDGDNSTDVDDDAITTKRVILRQAILYIG